MATLTVNVSTTSGSTFTYASCGAGGDVFANSGREIVAVHNNHATLARTVTITTTATADGLAVGDRTVSIPALETRWIGTFPTYLYGSTIALSYSVPGDMTVAVVKIVPTPY